MTPSRTRPLLAGRESEYGVYLARDRSRQAAEKLLLAAARLFPAVGGDRHGGPPDPCTIFTDNEVFYLDPWCSGGRRHFTLEAAGYECDDPWMIQRRATLSEARLRQAARAVEEDEGLRPGAIRILALGDDFYRCRTRGYHVNILVREPLGEAEQQTLSTWLAASSVLLGAGGLGGRRGVVCDGRIEHLNRASAAMGRGRVRTLFNLGRGSTAGSRGHRLHLMHQGSPRLSMILSDGLTMMVIRALEAGFPPWREAFPRPVAQMQALNRSRDPLAFRMTAASGRLHGVVELLRRFLFWLEEACTRLPAEMPPWGSGRVLPAFSRLLHAAARGDRLFLAARLDAWMRWRLYDEVAFERYGLRLEGLARWMPVAALLGREGIFRRWDGTPRRKGRRPSRLAQIRREVGAATREMLERIVEWEGLGWDDPVFPRCMDAVRDLADLEFSLGSAREDNPLSTLVRCGYVSPLFGASLREEAGADPPVSRNRSRGRAILIRRHSRQRSAARRRRRETLHASWNRLTLQELDADGSPARTRIYDLSDPLRRGVPRAAKPREKEERGARMAAEALVAAQPLFRCSGMQLPRLPRREPARLPLDDC